MCKDNGWQRLVWSLKWTAVTLFGLVIGWFLLGMCIGAFRAGHNFIMGL